MTEHGQRPGNALTRFLASGSAGGVVCCPEIAMAEATSDVANIIRNLMNSISANSEVEPVMSLCSLRH